MAQSKKDATLDLLFGRAGVTITDVKFFVGASSPSAEAMWGEFHSALRQEQEGSATISTAFVDPAPIKKGSEFLASL